MIVGLTGPEGSGKTAAMTYLCLRHYADGGRIWTFPGYDVFLPHKAGEEGEKISKELPMEGWLSMGDELQDAMIAIDEIQNFFDAQRFASTMNKLFGYLAAQRRKRSLAIVYTVQNWRWVDNRIRWLTHILGICYDLYWSPWGKEEKLGRGNMMRLGLWDLKGFFTGREQQPLGEVLLKTKELWPCFDSYGVVSIWDGFSRVKVNRPEMEINFG